MNLLVFSAPSVQFSHSVVSNSLWPCGLQHASLPVHHQLLKLAQTHVHWVGDAIQPSHPLVPFSSSLQSFPASVSFPMRQFFSSGGQTIGASISGSVLPVYIQHWFPLGLTGLISLQSKRLSSVFSNTTVYHARCFLANRTSRQGGIEILWSHWNFLVNTTF